MFINYRSRAPQCGVCDAFSDDLDKKHPISHAIDGSNRWWQSPTLHHGKEYERVSITLDLGQVRFYKILFDFKMQCGTKFINFVFFSFVCG